MIDQWYYASGGQQVGPVPAEVVRQMVAAGQLYGTDMVWRDGMVAWVPLSAVPELLPPGGIPLGYGVANYGVPEGVAYAGFWLRVVAWIIDAIIGAVAAAIVSGVLGAMVSVVGLGRSDWKLLSNLVSIAIGWLYMALMESSEWQASLGKMALGLRVTDLEGRRISFARATGRHFAKFVSALILWIGFIMVAFTQRKQGLHDIMAGTLVVRRSDRW